MQSMIGCRLCQVSVGTFFSDGKGHFYLVKFIVFDNAIFCCSLHIWIVFLFKNLLILLKQQRQAYEWIDADKLRYF